MKEENKKRYIITIDGPAGSGKSTIARELAKRLKINFLSSGKIYRTFAYLVNQYGYEKARELIYKIEITQDGSVIFDGKNIDEIIASEIIGQKASEISRIKEVRDIVNHIQRKIVYNEPKSFVVEGRDEGTEVFKEAELKIFLTASLEERARRKYLEHKDKNVEYFINKLKERDQMDLGREISPLKIPNEAIIIDTTDQTISQVVEKIICEVQKRCQI